MKIAVTGATGFIGRSLTAHLLRDGHDVTAIVRTPGAALPDGVTRVVAALTPVQDDLYDRVGRPDVLIHLAWSALDDLNAPDHVERELPAQIRFLETLIAGGLQRLVAAGTCLEYGAQYGPLAETAVADPTTAYGLAKDGLRRHLQRLQARHDFSLAWARLFYMHGPAARRRTLFVQLQEAVERGETHFPMSFGEQLRDYLHVDEVAARLAALAHAPNPGVVNVCSGDPISVRRLVETWLAERNWTIALDLGRFPYPEYEPLAFWGRDEKFRQVTGRDDRGSAQACAQDVSRGADEIRP